MNMEFFYLAWEHGNEIKKMENFLFGALTPMGEGRFYFLKIGLEYMISAHLAELTNQTGCNLDNFSDISLKILDAENEKEIDKIVSECLAEYNE